MKKWAYPLAILSFLIFIVVAWNLKHPSLLSLDENLATLLGGNKFISTFHYLGNTDVIVTIALVMLLYLAVRRNYQGMLLILLTFGLGRVLNRALKLYFERPRPEMVDQLSSFSFPSSHSQMSMLYLLTVAYIFSERFTNRKQKHILWITAIVLICLIGLSRIAGGHHYFTDVIAGWSIGYTWFILCILWYELRRKNNSY